MPKQFQRPDHLIRLTPALFHILPAVADTDKHGYAIMQEMEGLPVGKLKLGTGTLFGAEETVTEGASPGALSMRK